MRVARRFFSREKQVFLVGFSLTVPRFPRKSKNRNPKILNASLGKLCSERKACRQNWLKKLCLSGRRMCITWYLCSSNWDRVLPKWFCHHNTASQVACNEYVKPSYLSFNVKTYSPVWLATTYLICYSKTILKIQATIHPSKTNFLGIFSYKQVLNFKKLNAEEKNPQTKNHTKRRNLWINRNSKNKL